MTASDVLVQCRSAENIGMMGSQTSRQEGLFYSFNLEDHIPSDHLLRGIDRFLDLAQESMLP